MLKVTNWTNMSNKGGQSLNKGLFIHSLSFFPKPSCVTIIYLLWWPCEYKSLLYHSLFYLSNFHMHITLVV